MVVEGAPFAPDPLMQFRIRILLFLTLVAAIWFGLMSLFLPLGCIASVPIMIATVRTLRRAGDRETSLRWLSVTFGYSLMLIFAISATILLSAPAFIGTVLIEAVRRVFHVGVAIVAFLHQAATRVHVSRLASFTAWLARSLWYLVTGLCALTSLIWIRLHRTNRALFAEWAH